MKHWIGWMLVCMLALIYTGCSTTQSGQHKTTDLKNLMTLNVSGESKVDVYVDLGGLTTSTDAETESGDADAQTAITPSASLYGPSSATGPDGETLMDIGKYMVEAWRKWNADNVDNSDNSQGSTPAQPPSSGGDVSPDEPGDVGDGDGDDFDVVGVAICDGEMTYRDEDETVGIPQKVCTFRDWTNCEDVPVESFTLIFADPTGNTRELEVPDRCSISMGSKDEGYIKWRPAHDKEPFKPVGYAPRGFNASEAKVVGKK